MVEPGISALGHISCFFFIQSVRAFHEREPAECLLHTMVSFEQDIGDLNTNLYNTIYNEAKDEERSCQNRDVLTRW